MKLIQLTYLDDTEVFLNPMHIVAVDTSDRGVTQVLVIGTADVIHVKELPQRVALLVEED
jgi:hypothetical protein